MPILACEPDLYPSDLFDSTQPYLETEGRWFACYCRPNQEKQLMRRLVRHEVAHYCPLVPKKNRSPAGRIRTSHIPLFTGYVFIHGDETVRYTAMTTDCVSRWLDVPDSESLEVDLKRIYQLILSGESLEAESRLVPGTPVRVRRGPFEGMSGVIIHRHGQCRLLIAVNFLQQGASVLIDQYDVEQIY
jgi:transcriptional antiterminator RfaH